AARLGGDEAVEQPRQDGGRDAGACVVDHDAQHAAALMYHFSGRQIDLLGAGVARIVDQVDEDLLEPRQVAGDHRQNAVDLDAHLYAGELGAMPGKVDRALDRVGGIETRGRIARAAAHERAQVAHDAAGALDLVGDALELAGDELDVGRRAVGAGLLELGAGARPGDVDDLQRLGDLV